MASSLLIPDVEDGTLDRLRQRANAHGRTPEAEAKAILEHGLGAGAASGWEQADALRERLAASGRSFGDSAALLREDRER